MSCNCAPPDKTPLWSPIPEYRQPTQIQQGENLDCYMRRAGSQSGLKNDIGAKGVNLIDNTALTSDLSGGVDVTFKLTPGSSVTVTGWLATIDGIDIHTVIPELTLNSLTGRLMGTVNISHANKKYEVLIVASNGTTIDSRRFTFFPKLSTKDNTVKFVFPLDGNSHVTCGFGPRVPPAIGASSQHNGVDIARTDHSIGNIVAAADGVVVKTGPAAGFGNWIVIEHRDAQEVLVATTVYGHMNDGNTYVTVGQKVSAGQKIALEGNAGIGSGSHLHFEIHKGRWRNPVDPTAYLNGTYNVANNNNPSVIDEDGTPAPANGTSSIINTNTGMTSDEAAQANTDCPATITGDGGTAGPGPEVPAVPPVVNIPYSRRASCAPTSSINNYTNAQGAPITSEILHAIQLSCGVAGYYTNSTTYTTDYTFILTVATIESNLDPYAKNPTSSATGLYQMLDSTAIKYYDIIGYPATCTNRCNPSIATKAFIAFYQAEILHYWNEYGLTGKLAGKSIEPTSWSAGYSALEQGAFMYGLIHHDGVGNAVKGLDKQGVAYWRSKVGTGTITS